MINYDTVAALADNTAYRLAYKAFSDVELQEALLTTPSHNGVRIGKCSISYRYEEKDRIYDIAFGTNNITDIAFYETARVIVKTINTGQSHSCPLISHLVKINGEFRRARDRVRFHSERMQYYIDKGDEFRADLNDSKLARDVVQLNILRHRLLHDTRNY